MSALSVGVALLVISGKLVGRSAMLVISGTAAISGAVTNLGLSGWPIIPLILMSSLLVVAADTWRETQRRAAVAVGPAL